MNMPRYFQTSADRRIGKQRRRGPVLLAVLLLGACSQAPEAPLPEDKPASSEAARTPESAAATGSDAQSAAEPTIRRAARALAQKRLFEPAGDNALELYLQVIDEAAQEGMAPDSAADEGRLRRLSDSVGADPKALAQQTLADLFPYGMLWVKRAIEQQRFADASRVIDLLERAQPGAQSLHTLREALASAEDKRDAAIEAERLATVRAGQAPAVASPPVVAASSTTARLAPPAPVAAATPQASAVPSSAGSSSRTATASAGPAATDTVQSPSSVPARAGVKPAPVSESGLALVLERQVTPRYPNRARRQRIEGWVEVRFMVEADGSVADPKVVDAEPRGVFDREAVEAVRRWKYAPPGRATDTSRRIEFRLNS